MRTVIRRWLALEYAVAPVQSNPEALVVSAKAPSATAAATDAANAAAKEEIDLAVGKLDVHLMVADEIERLRGRV